MKEVTKCVCPECGEEAIGLEVIEEVESWDEIAIRAGPPGCPMGHGIITQEGLLENEKGIIGKGGLLISSGSTQVERLGSLLETISRLDTPDPQGKLIDLREVIARKWNRKRAKRYFFNWFRDSDNNLSQISKPRLQEVANRLIAEYREQDGNEEYWPIDRWASNGFLDELRQYEERKNEEPVLFLNDAIPGDVRRAFEQVRECYRWGLSDAGFGLCRRILEISLYVVDEIKRDVTWPTPVNNEFASLVNCFPDEVLATKEKEWIKYFWKRSSRFLHGLEEPDNAWEALHNTAAILQRLATRKAFERD